MSYPQILMRASALVLGLLGLAGTFMPDSVLAGIGAPLSPALMLLVQILGALYLGFASLNWMVRDNLIGGIYGRPVATGNLVHFLTAGLAAIKHLPQAAQLPALWPIALVYALFATGFAVVLVRHPIRGAAQTSGG